MPLPYPLVDSIQPRDSLTSVFQGARVIARSVAITRVPWPCAKSKNHTHAPCQRRQPLEAEASVLDARACSRRNQIIRCGTHFERRGSRRAASQPRSAALLRACALRDARRWVDLRLSVIYSSQWSCCAASVFVVLLCASRPDRSRPGPRLALALRHALDQ